MAATATMPSRLPSFRSPDAAVGPDACPLHGPTSPYTRNTLGYYSSYAPTCCGPLYGCTIGIQEAIECRLAEAIMEDIALLCHSHSSSQDQSEVVTRLQANYERLRNMTSVLLTPLTEAQHVLARFVTG
jgi:hypothetical protein